MPSCAAAPEEGFDPQQVFLLEGLLDRQMDDGRVENAARYALRERLKGWFADGNQRATSTRRCAAKVDPRRDTGT